VVAFENPAVVLYLLIESLDLEGAKMDSYERFVRTLNFEEPDRVATWDMVNNVDLYTELGGAGPINEVVPRTYQRLGIDATRWPIGLPPTESKTWCSDRFGFLVSKNQFKFKTIPEQGTTWLVESPFKTLGDLTDVQMEPLSESEILDEFIPIVQSFMKAYEKFGVVYIFCGATIFDDTVLLLGWPLFTRAVYQERNKLRKLLDKFTYVQEVLAKGWAELDPAAYMYGDDIAYKHGLMISPKFLREDWLPRVKRVIEPVRKKGIKALFHSDGNLWRFIDDLIEVGFEGLNPIEPAAYMDIGDVKAKYGDKLVLLGNIDCSQVLPLGSASDVEKATVECIRKAAPGSGFCLGSSSEIIPAIPMTNAVTMYKTARKYGLYPRAQKRNAQVARRRKKLTEV